ncbi:Uncharacterised protein [uncultured archaeon]|nr:Uncharacterised protein [uncultured archaeon]
MFLFQGAAGGGSAGDVSGLGCYSKSDSDRANEVYNAQLTEQAYSFASLIIKTILNSNLENIENVVNRIVSGQHILLPKIGEISKYEIPRIQDALRLIESKGLEEIIYYGIFNKKDDQYCLELLERSKSKIRFPVLMNYAKNEKNYSVMNLLTNNYSHLLSEYYLLTSQSTPIYTPSNKSTLAVVNPPSARDLPAPKPLLKRENFLKRFIRKLTQ